MNQEQQGIVLSYHSNFYTVQIDGISYQCVVRGMLKKEGTHILVGDQVQVDNLDPNNLSGRITDVLARETELSRPKVSNVDTALIVSSIQSPALDLTQLDRYITHVQLAGISPHICISKSDLAETPEEIEATARIYTHLAIPVYVTSNKEPQSVQKLFEAMKGKTVVLAGQSGVGKSSLLNTLKPELNLKEGEVSEKLERGQHTTRQASLIALGENTFVADTPGFSYLKFDFAPPAQIEAVFSDFAPYREQCRFHDCLHLDETECAVLTHLDKIASSRYASYTQFQGEAREYKDTLQTTSQKEEYGYKTLHKGKGRQGKHVRILKLKNKQREASRRKQNQETAEWTQVDNIEEE